VSDEVTASHTAKGLSHGELATVLMAMFPTSFGLWLRSDDGLDQFSRWRRVLRASSTEDAKMAEWLLMETKETLLHGGAAAIATIALQKLIEVAEERQRRSGGVPVPAPVLAALVVWCAGVVLELVQGQLGTQGSNQDIVMNSVGVLAGALLPRLLDGAMERAQFGAEALRAWREGLPAMVREWRAEQQMLSLMRDTRLTPFFERQETLTRLMAGEGRDVS
jgi:hypothetical protein